MEEVQKRPIFPSEIETSSPPENRANQAGGASFKIDFTKIKEKTITLGRFNPATTKLLLTKAEVVGMRGFSSERCSTETLIRVKDPDGFHLRTATFGHHYVMVYGDYTQELSGWRTSSRSSASSIPPDGSCPPIFPIVLEITITDHPTRLSPAPFDARLGTFRVGGGDRGAACRVVRAR